MIPEKTKLNVDQIAAAAPNIFNCCKPYNTILHAAKILFGETAVSYNDDSIFIKDKVCIELSLSWNEPKAYIYTYFDLDLAAGERLENAKDVNYILRSINPSFRLFAVDEIIEYLIIKENENRFIQLNEG